MSLPAGSPEVSPTKARPGPRHTAWITGPRGAGKTRWLQARLRTLREAKPGLRCAVLSLEDGRTQWEDFSRSESGVTFGKLVMPCVCCPAAAGLPAAVSEMVRSTGAEFLFIEAPAVAAAGLLREFDQTLAWPREVVLCPGAKWTALRDRTDLPYFMASLLAQADVIVPPEPGASSTDDPTPPAAPTLSL